jgi:hypothetical protein
VSDLDARMRDRLAELRREWEIGQGRLAELERESAALQQSMLRIAGAIQVLTEMLPGERNGQTDPAVARAAVGVTG